MRAAHLTTTDRKSTRPSEPRISFRWQEFRSFFDTDWVEIRPITIFIGANNSGKTSLVLPLLLLKQTLLSSDESICLKTSGPIVNAGQYRDIVFQHNSKRQIRFHFAFQWRPLTPKRQKLLKSRLGRPGKVSFTFVQGKNSREIKLSNVEVRNEADQLIFARSLLASSQYSLKVATQISEGFKKVIRASKPEHFLFSPIDEMLEYETNFYKKRRGKRLKVGRFEGPTGPNRDYIGALIVAAGAITEFLQSLSYLGPLREHPKRLFQSTDEIPESVGTRGENTPQVLYLRKDRQFHAGVRKWIREFNLAEDIFCDPLGHGAFVLRVRGMNRQSDSDYADVGFGMSQVLPLIVQGLHAEPGSVTYVEQPEIHLNPRLQSTLANFFAELAKSQKFAVIETHSEHFLLRIRSLIAEGSLHADDVALYYVEKEGSRSVQRRIQIERDGHIKPNEWPKGFFEDALGESLRLASLQSS
jgi:hypothetical protein